MSGTMNIVETRDVALVRSIAEHFSVRDNVTDDGWQKFGDDLVSDIFKILVEKPENHCLIVELNGVPAGAWLLDAKGTGVFEVHTMLLPECRGKLAIRAGRLAMARAVEFPEVTLLESFCPANLPQTLFYALACGWKVCQAMLGTTPRKWIKNGVEHDMTRVQITKDEILCL